MERKNYLLGGIVALLLACNLGGCATTEREALERLDLTGEIIRQSSDLLAIDAELSRFPIEVDGFKNDMRVKGYVATEAQKRQAENIVWAVRGVRSVENKLKLKAP